MKYTNYVQVYLHFVWFSNQNSLAKKHEEMEPNKTQNIFKTRNKVQLEISLKGRKARQHLVKGPSSLKNSNSYNSAKNRRTKQEYNMHN